MQRLILASKAAREGSLDALRQQYQRLVLNTLPPQRALPPPRRGSIDEEADSIFCRYSLDLQYVPRKPLSASFAPGGGGRCPCCRVRLHVEPSNTYWHIEKRAPVIVSDGRHKEEVLEDHQFHLGQRFAVKCHTEDGEFACVLCHNYRSVDFFCGNVEALVNHVGKAHDVSELAKDVDLREKPIEQMALPYSDVPSTRNRQLMYHSGS
ncbi:hypothetical protein F5X99DRAFT_398013 [Biscogniauxia marginata]|nr:hypothetical protein F5X99DRAFT_398013 [Biscogniauxia marginata]